MIPSFVRSVWILVCLEKFGAPKFRIKIKCLGKVKVVLARMKAIAVERMKATDFYFTDLKIAWVNMTASQHRTPPSAHVALVDYWITPAYSFKVNVRVKPI